MRKISSPIRITPPRIDALPADMLSEGLEEVLADIVEPAAEWTITGNRPAYELDQIVEDGLTGVLLSAAGKGGQYVTNAIRNGHAADSALQSDTARGTMRTERRIFNEKRQRPSVLMIVLHGEIKSRQPRNSFG